MGNLAQEAGPGTADTQSADTPNSETGANQEAAAGPAEQALVDPSTVPLDIYNQVVSERDTLREANEKLSADMTTLTAENEKLKKIVAKKLAKPAPHSPKRLALPEAPGEPSDGPVELPEGTLTIAFSDGDTLLEDVPPVDVGPGDLGHGSDRLTLRSKISISGDVAPATITHAWLLADGKPVRRCEVPGGLRVGAGRSVEFASGSLAF